MSSTLIHVAAAAVWDGVNQVIIGQRAASDSFPGVWEFVGGKQDEGEGIEDALTRELHEELGIQVKILQKLGEHDFSNRNYNFRLHVFFALWISGIPQAFEHQEIQWINSQDLNPNLRNWSKPDLPFLNAVAKLLNRDGEFFTQS